MITHRSGLLLTNARTETEWFQRALAAAEAVLFPKKRIKFIRPNGRRLENPPAGQAIFAFHARDTAALERSGIDGIVVYTRPFRE